MPMVTEDRGDVRDAGTAAAASTDAARVATAGAEDLGEAEAVMAPSGTVAAAEAKTARTLRREVCDMQPSSDGCMSQRTSPPSVCYIANHEASKPEYPQMTVSSCR